MRLIAQANLGNIGRVVALDRYGRARAYGTSPGLRGFYAASVETIAVCPGSRFVVEVAAAEIRGDARAFLQVRRLSTMRVERTVRLPVGEYERNLLAGDFVGTVACFDSTGRRAYVFLSEGVNDFDPSRILLVNRRRISLVYEGHYGLEAVFARGRAFLYRPYEGLRRIIAVSLRTGRARTVARLRREPQSVAVSPDGQSLAAITQPPRSRRNRYARGRDAPSLHLFDARTGARRKTVRLRRIPFAPRFNFPTVPPRYPTPPPSYPIPPGPPAPAPTCPTSCGSGQAVWVSNRSVAFVPEAEAGRQTDLFTRHGRRRGRLPGFFGGPTAVLGRYLYRVEGRPEQRSLFFLQRARLPRGSPERLAPLAWPGSDLLVAVPGGPASARSARPR